jgi:hypothetical protein
MDNAIDFIDSNSKKFVELDETPYIHLIISEEKDKSTGKKVSKIVVRNSNAGLKVFSNDQIERIFNFERYYSSKRNRYQISRGALGGAFKDILGIPYALAFEDIESTANYEDWKYPMQINIANDKSIDVRIEITDKIKKRLNRKSKLKIYANNNTNKKKSKTIILR